MLKIVIILLLSFAAAMVCFDQNSFILVALVFLVCLLSHVFSNIYPVIFFFIIYIPDEVLYYYSGNMPEYGFGWIRVHPIIPAVLIFAVWTLITRLDTIKKLLAKDRWMTANIVILALFLLFSFVQTIVFKGMQGLTVLIENYLTPILLVMCVYTDLSSVDSTRREKMERQTYCALIVMITIAAAYGVIEYVLKKNMLYGEAISKMALFKTMTTLKYYRITSTLGHPLKNAYYYLFALNGALALFIFPLNLIFAVVNLIALLFTGSRVGFFLGILSVSSLFASKNIGKVKRIVLAVSVAVMIFIIVFQTPISDLVFHRMQTESLSSQVRVHSIVNLPDLLRRYFIIGDGFSSSADLSRKVLPIGESFENPWVMMLVDAGFVTMLLYLIFISRVFWMARRTVDYKVIIMAILLISLSSFSSHFRNTLNFLLFFNIATIIVGIRSAKEAS